LTVTLSRVMPSWAGTGMVTTCMFTKVQVHHEAGPAIVPRRIVIPKLTS
jgi:hypothetical protein